MIDSTTERSLIVEYLRGQCDIYREMPKRYCAGKDKEELLAQFIETGDRGALECYRACFIAETINVIADAIEDGRHGQPQ